MRILFTGGAGFIGSHAVEFLISEGHQVTVFDNLSTGKIRNLKKVYENPLLTFVQGDVCNERELEVVLPGHEVVFHFSDNSDIQFAASHPEVYINQNIVSLFKLLELMRKHKVSKILFPSSTTVIGDATVVPTPENYGPLKPMNLYGAGKLACEALLSAYAHTFGIQAWVFRFVGIVGPRMDHGVIQDFVKKLLNNPAELQILGNGKQQRNFLIVEDCVDAIWTAFRKIQEPLNLVHIGNVDHIEILKVAKIVCEVTGESKTVLRPSESPRGWTGDALSNAIKSDSLDRIQWKPKTIGSEAAVRMAARRILEHIKELG